MNGESFRPDALQPISGDGADVVERGQNPETDIWLLVARPESTSAAFSADALRSQAAEFATLASPVLAEFLLRPAAARLGIRLIPADEVEKSRLGNRFNLVQQLKWARAIADAGIETVYLKGFANAHTLYPEPELRTVGDLDLLIRRHDLDRLITHLAEHGFRFRLSPVNPWGSISDASFMPFVSADGSCNLDIHIEPDCYPAYRSLNAALLFDRAREIEADGFRFRVPCPEHALVLCATNAAKDKFGIFSVRKVIDALVLLRAGGGALDWEVIAALARDGGYLKPLRVFLCLLHTLGLPGAGIPAPLLRPPGGLAGPEFRRVVADFRGMFPHIPPLFAILRRELLLCAEPSVGLHNFGLRLRGLFRPGTGLPAGVSPHTGLPHGPRAGRRF